MTATEFTQLHEQRVNTLSRCHGGSRGVGSGAHKRRPIKRVDTGERWPCVRVAASALGVKENTLLRNTRRGFRCRGMRFEFVEAGGGKE